MPVPTETLWNIRNLNKWFGISAILGLVSMVWMLWHDYNRPWRHTQVAHANLSSALAHFTALSYESPEAKAQHAALVKAVSDAQAELEKDEVKNELDDLQRKEIEWAGELQGVSLAYGNLNAELSVSLFWWEEKKQFYGENSPEAIAAKDKYESEREAVAELKADQDALEDKLRDIRKRTKTMKAPLVRAEKALQAYEKGRNDAETRDELFGPGIKRGLINMPILDYAAPKGVAGRQEVRQVFMPDVRFDYNFIDSYVTDRCMTCHLSIDKPEFSKENFAHQAEGALQTERVKQALKEANEDLIQELARQLADVDLADFSEKDLSPSGDAEARDGFVNTMVAAANNYLYEIKRPFVDAGSVRRKVKDVPLDRGSVQSVIESKARNIMKVAYFAPGDATESRPLKYDDLDPSRQNDYLKSLVAAVNVYLEEDGRPEIEFKSVFAAHPRLDLFVSPTSPHAMKKMGCTVCHEGSGQETDFVLAAHTPKSKDEKKEWKKYYQKELGLPLATFHIVEEFWERPMLQPQYVSASCVKCHDQVYDLERHRTEPLGEARAIVEGRELFTRVGCINCHNVDGLTDSRRVGTDLNHVAGKLSTGFMERWIEYPNDFRPSTRMPHFFRQENNVISDANEFDDNPILRTETEIKAIAHYLKTFSRNFDPLPLPEGLEGDAKRGEELLISIGCLACHVNLDAHDPLDSDGKTFGENWIVKDLAVAAAMEKIADAVSSGAEPSASDKETAIEEAMADAKTAFEAMSKNDRVRYAVRQFTDQRRNDAIAASEKESFRAGQVDEDPDPFKMYVPPKFTRQGPELSGMGTKLVSDPNDADDMQHGRQWLYSWLREPRHYASYTVMPRMFRDNYYQELSPEERRQKNDQDLLDVAEYLLSLRHDTFDSTEIEETNAHQEKMEELILSLLGGQNTASVSKMILEDTKADVSDSYGPLTRAIVEQAKGSFGGGDEGRREVAALIESRSSSLADRQKLFLGMKMISHYGCYACHTIAGFEEATRPGTDLSLWAQKFLSQLDFAFFSPVFDHEREENPDVFGNIYIGDENGHYAHLLRDTREDRQQIVGNTGESKPQEILHNHASFAYHKMRNPRIWDRGKYKKPYELLKMPNYFLTEDEATSVTTYLLSRRAPGVSDKLKINYKNTATGRVARGRRLARELNCVGCHTIEGFNEPNIEQYYTSDTSRGDEFEFGKRFLPPLLWGEGAKIQYDWLFGFLNNVEMLRPWLKARMPSFYLSNEDATILVEYFAGLSDYESQMLRDELAPVAKYLQQAHSGKDLDPNWFAQARFKETARFLKRFALAHEQVKVYDFDTTDSTPEEALETLSDTFNTVKTRSNFIADLNQVNYPFSDNRQHVIDDERFQLGEEFFYDQKCLACHVGGDPSVPGTTTDIKAPNFSLTWKRLRYDWVMKWLMDPQAIQPGANMPQIFPDGKNAYSSWSGELKTQKEEKFGTDANLQAALLTDYLFEMGRRGHTAIQPGALDAPKAGESDEDVEFDFGDEEETEDSGDVEFDFD